MVQFDLAGSTRSEPQQRGWAIAGREVVQCEGCKNFNKPAWHRASICADCFARDYERAYCQRRAQVLAVVDATRAEWKVR